jgi:hypothetical protein
MNRCMYCDRPIQQGEICKQCAEALFGISEIVEKSEQDRREKKRKQLKSGADKSFIERFSE